MLVQLLLKRNCDGRHVLPRQRRRHVAPSWMRSCGRLLAPHARAASTAAIDTSPKKAIEYCVAHVRSVHPAIPCQRLRSPLTPTPTALQAI